MKRSLPLALLLVAGCHRAPPADNASAPAAASVRAVRAVALTEKTDTLDWSVGWPAEAAAIPAVDAWLRRDAAQSKTAAIKSAAEDLAAAKRSDYSFVAHTFDQRWSVEGSPAELLSLSGAFDVFEGGAHGMSGWKPLLWDRRADRPVEIPHLFTDTAAANAALAKVFCPALDAERAKRRGEPVTPNPDDPFTQCPKLGDQVLVPAGPAGQPFNKLRVLVGPYEAGSYAEGSYEVTLPVTAEITGLVKPEYQAAFEGK